MTLHGSLSLILTVYSKLCIRQLMIMKSVSTARSLSLSFHVRLLRDVTAINLMGIKTLNIIPFFKPPLFCALDETGFKIHHLQSLFLSMRSSLLCLPIYPSTQHTHLPSHPSFILSHLHHRHQTPPTTSPPSNQVSHYFYHSPTSAVYVCYLSLHLP